jgi:hypothetical protein
MIDISGYTVNTSMPIKVVVDADSTSATISWEYVCNYKENGCDYCSINGSESMNIALTPLNKCNEDTISSSFTWNNIEIEYEIEQRPNPTYEPRVEYKITKISGVNISNNSVSFNNYSGDCGEGKDIEVDYEYSAITYENNCGLSSATWNSGTTTLSFDCTDNISDDDITDVTSLVNILGNDIEYTYKCSKCEGSACTPSTRISNIKVLSYSANGINYTDTGLPCSGQTGITAVVEYRVVKTDKHCHKESYYETSAISGINVEKCSEYDCCRAHMAKISTKIYGVLVDLELLMAADTTGDCFTGCGQTCESGITATVASWSVIVNGNKYGDGGLPIDKFPVIPLSSDTILEFSYTIDYDIISTNCKISSGSVTSGFKVTIASADCKYHTYTVITNDGETILNGCDEQHPTFEIRNIPDVYPTEGEGAQLDLVLGVYEFKQEIEGTEYTFTIELPYSKQKCKEYKD